MHNLYNSIVASTAGRPVQCSLSSFSLILDAHVSKYVAQIKLALDRLYLILIVMQQQSSSIHQHAFSDKGYPYHQNVDVSDMCANIGYILVLPLTSQQALQEQNFQTVPFVITYEHQDIKIYQLVTKYRSMDGNAKNEYTYFTYKNGYKLGEEMTIRSVMKQLGRRNLNDLVLYTATAPEFTFNSYEELLQEEGEDIYINQSAVQQFLVKQEEFGNQTHFKITVEIPLTTRKLPEMVTLKVEGQILGSQLKQAILDEIKLQFGVNYTQDHMDKLLIKQSGEPVLDHEKLLPQNIFNRSVLVQHLKNNNTQLKRPFAKECKSELVIYKIGEKEPRKFDYSEIAEFTFDQLYRNHLELDDSKKRTDLSYGLKIEDIIIKPDERISRAKVYFERESQQKLSVVGKVVDETMIFYYTIPALLSKSEEFKIDKYIEIPENQETKRNKYREMLRERAKKTENQYFKIEERLEPILIYTAELYYYEDKPSNKTATVYESLNRFLRTTPILSLDFDSMKKQWRYLYSNALLTHLKKIPAYVGPAYRGINYDPNAQVGKIITFKQFLSTSTKRQVGLSFAKKSADKLKRMFEFNLLQGYPITEFSIYTGEQEVLLEPFADFEVLEIKQTKEKIKNPLAKGSEPTEEEYDFQIYVLQQKITNKKLPDIRANFIVWIDDKPKEGQIIYSKIDMPQQMTVFVQILSTESLAKWLQTNKFLFNDKTANLIFVSNMTRKEGNKLNELAGIEGLNLIREIKEDAEVFFYVGNLQRLEEKLTMNNVDRKNLMSGVKSLQVYQYITDRIRRNQ